MIRATLIVIVFISGAFAMTTYHVGYKGAGSDYIKKVRNERKSIRSGSGYFVPFMSGSRSFRRGK